GTRFSVAFPSRPEPDADPAAWAAGLREEGFLRVQVGPDVFRLDEGPLPDPAGADQVWALVDRLEAGRVAPQRFADSVETAFARGQGRMALLTDWEELAFDQRSICPRCNIEYPPLEPRLFNFNDPLGACPTCEGTGVASGKSRGGGGPCPTC